MKVSKYVSAGLAMILLAAGWLGWKVDSYIEEYSVTSATIPEMEENLLCYQLDNLWDTAGYDFSAIINAEKGYYGVCDGDGSYRIVDKNNRTLKSLEEYGIDMIYSAGLTDSAERRYVAAIDRVPENYRFYIIDRETLEVYDTGHSWIEMHSAGGYYIAAQMKGYKINARTVKSGDGKLIYGSVYPLELTSDSGYVLERLYLDDGWLVEKTGMTLEELEDEGLFSELNPDYMEGNSRLIDIYTGEVLYTAKEGETIRDYQNGCLIMIGRVKGSDGVTGEPMTAPCWFLRSGEHFEVALNGQLFSSFTLEDGLVIGLGYREAYLDGEENHFGMDGENNWAAMFFTLDGQLLYEGKRNSRVDGDRIHGGFAVVDWWNSENPRTETKEYIKLSDLTAGR